MTASIPKPSEPMPCGRCSIAHRRTGSLPGPACRPVSRCRVRVCDDSRKESSTTPSRATIPEVAFSIKHPGFPDSAHVPIPGARVGAMDSDRRFGLRSPAPLGRRAGDRDQRGRRARAVSRRERHRGDARARLRIPELCRAATRAPVEVRWHSHRFEGPYAAGGRIRQALESASRNQRQGARHAGAGHSRDAFSASRRRTRCTDRTRSAHCFPRADFVSLHVRLSPATRGMLSRDELAAMRPRRVPRQHLAGAGRRRGGSGRRAAFGSSSRAPTSMSSRPSRCPPRARSGPMPNVLITPHSVGQHPRLAPPLRGTVRGQPGALAGGGAVAERGRAVTARAGCPAGCRAWPLSLKGH